MPISYIGNIRGPQGLSVTEAIIGGDDRLRLTLGDGSIKDAGVARGAQGLAGVNGVANDTATASYITTSGTSATKSALTARYERKTIIAPGIAGVIGDGVTDDTDAIQALIDLTPVGGKIVFALPAAGNIWIINGNLLISKYNITITSGTRDPYGITLVKRSGSGAIITVKAPTFNADSLSFIGDAINLNGEAATMTGIDFYGTPEGNIDAFVTKCSFYRLAVGVRVRSRNIRIVDNLFSNCLNGVTSQGKDATYHNSSADNVRGVVVKDNRFHSIGFTAADSIVNFTNTLVDLRHAQVSDNYFDAWGLGRAIVANGTSAYSIKGLAITGNKHEDVRSTVYDLTYCEDSVITATVIMGDKGGGYNYDAINLTYCNVITIDTVFMSRVGRSSIVSRNSGRIRVANLVVQVSGIYNVADPAVMGHGLDFDFTNTQCRFVNIAVQGISGYGLTGSPSESNLEGSQFRNCVLGRINSTTIREATVFKSGADFIATLGTPAPGNIQNHSCLLFDASTSEQAASFVNVPSAWALFDIELYWVNTADTSGNVAFQVAYYNPAENTALAGGTIITYIAAVSTGALNRLQKFTAFTNVTPSAMGATGIRIIRTGAATTDTYPADVGVVGVRLVRVS